MCTTESPCHSKTLEMSVPMWGATLGCEKQDHNGEPMSQYYGSVLQSTTMNYELQSTTPALLRTTKYCSGTSARSNLVVQNALELRLRHSCLMIIARETSSKMRRATRGMQNALELRHSCLMVVAHKTYTSSTLRGATS